jgi:hypothetical protein
MEKTAIMTEGRKLGNPPHLKPNKDRTRTVDGDKPGDGLPNPSPPRVGAHANEEGEKGHDAKAYSQMGQVTRTSPLDAKVAILLVTTIAYAFGEIAAFEARVDLLPTAVRVRDLEHLTLATLHEAIVDDELGVEKLSSRINEPGIKGFKRRMRCKKWVGVTSRCAGWQGGS